MLSLVSATINVDLNSPADDSTSLTPKITFNASANVTGGTSLINMSLWTNETGSWSLRNSTTLKGDSFGFDGSNDYLKMDRLGIDQNLSISFWVYFDSIEAGDSLIKQRGPSAGGSCGINCDNIFDLMTNSDGTFDGYINDGDEDGNDRLEFNSGADIYNSDVNVSTGWNHISLTYNNDLKRVRVYVNASLSIEDTNPSFTPIDSSEFYNHLFIMGHNVAWQGDDPTYIDGRMDEYRLYVGKTLSASEVTTLYNLQAPPSGITTYLDFEQSSGNALDQIGSNDGEYNGNDRNLEGISSGYNSTQIFTNTYSSGDEIEWNIQACDSNGDCNFSISNHTFTIDSSAPSITINSPSPLEDYGANGINETLNITASDDNLDSCWYNYNGTNITFSCSTGTPATTNITLSNSDTDLIVYSNDTVGNLNSEVVEWDYKLFENSRTFNSTAYETSYETYSVNLTANSSLTGVKLNYNGTDYTMSNSGNIWSYSRDLPSSVIGSQDFYFKFTYAGDTINSDNDTQTVSSIFFGLCNATYSNDFLNISFKDEADLSTINATITTSTFEYYLGTGTETKTYNFINNTANYDYTFCASPTGETFNVDPYIQYTNSGYPQRIWNPDVQQYNSTVTDKTLYLLGTADGIYVTFQTINSADQTLSGVTITVEREISGSDVNISTGTTGDSGTSTFWLNPDFVHTFTFEKSGFETYTTTFAPTQDSYTVTLSGGTDSSTNLYDKGIKLYYYPTDQELFNDTAYDFAFNLTSSYWDVDSFGFSLRLANGTIVSSDSSTSTGTAALVNYDVNNQSIIYMDYYWIIEGNTTSGTTYWIVTNTNYTGWSIKTFFTDFKAYLDTEMFGIDNFGRLAIVFLILFISVGVMSFKYGLTSPLTITSMIFAIVFFFDVVVGLIPSIRGINYILTYLSGLILALVIVREARQ